MAIVERKTKVIEGLRPDTIPWRELIAAAEPVVLKGLAGSWELVQAGRRSASEAIAYLKSFYNGRTVGAYLGSPEIGGRYFYKDDLSGLNFRCERLPLDQVLDDIARHLDNTSPPSIYVGSTTLDACLPGLRARNDLSFDSEMFAGSRPLTSIWIGNPSIASAHYDAPNNLACCAVGRRRFTLFPPEQIANLYPGPLDLTPGGQAVSMVDFANPDFEKFPRFRDALAAAQVAELEPGDAVFYPSLWWHQVEALSPFNVLINYWWSDAPGYMGTPMNALYHALLSLRDRPEQEKQAWRHIFDYYIFGTSDLPREHLPEKACGVLGPVDEDRARQLRAMLLHKMNR
ncbi:cupin-like domain-containing protein [Microbulbifer thermotolerans]|uniref:Cupin n=1 Tax=Microbulbifer thermotolerans TaxID=252514 RepID=A0A143HPI1_MICTH|nr:cupin-like domain-containing protein [Microbulbifer thermotolerans]AMX03407.1 cupin [Microbulbifer thermotolerans]MCX2783039.1 cupin-like domain-containing protein [Microbulbifer thermotolerans]MCX2842350.1 cupin-like domain-containing protein [Microbulbifer thermotolerans]